MNLSSGAVILAAPRHAGLSAISACFYSIWVFDMVNRGLQRTAVLSSCPNWLLRLRLPNLGEFQRMVADASQRVWRQPPSAMAASRMLEMDSTVRQHINGLKARIDLLTKEMMDDWRTEDDRKRSQAEIGIAYLALAHYEAAIKEERKLLPPKEIV